MAFVSWLSWGESTSEKNVAPTPSNEMVISPSPSLETPLPEEQQDVTRWPTYTHKNGFYKIKFPPEWFWRRSIIEETGEIVGFDDVSVPELRDNYSGKVSIKITNQSRIDFVSSQEKLLGDVVKEDIVIDGETATQIKGKWLDNAELFPGVIQEYIVVERGGRTFVIGSGFVTDENIRGIFNSMISSFDLLR